MKTIAITLTKKKNGTLHVESLGSTGTAYGGDHLKRLREALADLFDDLDTRRDTLKAADDLGSKLNDEAKAELMHLEEIFNPPVDEDPQPAQAVAGE